MQATGNGSAVSIPFRKESAWAAAVAGGLLEWRATSHLGFRADMDLVVPFVRDHFVVSGVGEVHTPAVVSARALAGVEARFP